MLAVCQIVSELLQPSAILSVVALLGLANLWRKRRESWRRLLLVTVPVVLLVACTVPAVGFLAMGSLESFYPQLDQVPEDAQAIVVLGGHVESVNESGKQFEPGNDTLRRCIRAAEIYRQARGRTVVVSAGKLNRESPEPDVAEVMRDYLIRQGVESADLIVEAESQSTYENAVACRQLLEARGIHKIVLVTEAFHLHRAVGCFRKQGLEVVPCGCRYRAQNYEGRFRDFVPKPWALSYCHKVAHEWVGVAWYLLHDRM